MEDEHAVDVRGLAELLQVSTSTVYRLAATRETPSFRVGSRLRFWPSEVRRELSSRDPWARSPQSRAARYRGARKRISEGRLDRGDEQVLRRYGG